MDDLKRRSTAIMSKAELEKLQSERKDSPEAESGSRLTRLKAQQIASGIRIIVLNFKILFARCTFKVKSVFKEN